MSDVEERDEGGEIKIVRNGRRSGREWLEEILLGTKRGGWCRKDEGGDEGGERKVRMEKTQDREERRGVFNDMCKEVWRDGEMLKRLVLTRGVEKKSKGKTMTMTTLTEDVSNSCQSPGPFGMSEGTMAHLCKGYTVSGSRATNMSHVTEKMFSISGPQLWYAKC